MYLHFTLYPDIKRSVLFEEIHTIQPIITPKGENGTLLKLINGERLLAVEGYNHISEQYSAFLKSKKA